LGIAAGHPLDRAAVNRDLVREDAGVVRAAPPQRDALVQAEEGLAGRWLVLDGHGHVGHLVADVRGQGVERIADQLLERVPGTLHLAKNVARPTQWAGPWSLRPRYRAYATTSDDSLAALYRSREGPRPSRAPPRVRR